jgi:chlorite dismutase
MKQVAEASAAPTTREQTITFSCFWVFQVEPEWKRRERTARQTGVDEAINTLAAAQRNGVRLRGAYSLGGFRAGADFMLWWLTEEPARLQEAALALTHTGLGEHLRYREVYLGMAAGSKYTDDHQAAFMKGEAPRQYANVYPFSKTPEWYLLPYEKRRQLMEEHGAVGRPFAVATNTVQAFGLGDSEFIVALESDSLAELVRCVEALRKAEVRRYTQQDVPIYLGRLQPLDRLLAELV